MKIIILALLSLTILSCTRVSTGELGIKRDFWGEVSDEVVTQGLPITILSDITVIDATQVRVMANDVKAKDIDGILFSDIDVQAVYNVKKDGAIKFYKQTREVDCVRENDSRSCENVLGYRVIHQELVNSVSKAVNKFKSNDVNTNKQAIEEEVKNVLVEKLESLYPGSFEVTNVNINSAQLDPSVERVLQAQALLDSEKRLMSSRMELQTQQTELLKKELSEMKDIASKSGISLVELMRFRNEKERIKVMSEFAKNSPNVQLQLKDKDQ